MLQQSEDIRIGGRALAIQEDREDALRKGYVDEIGKREANLKRREVFRMEVCASCKDGGGKRGK
jgi:hypothetical protein